MKPAQVMQAWAQSASKVWCSAEACCPPSIRQCVAVSMQAEWQFRQFSMHWRISVFILWEWGMGNPLLEDRPLPIPFRDSREFANTVVMVDYRKIITLEPGKRSGKPCIRGMRITVYDVLSYLAGGMSIEEVLVDFPYLTHDDILACLAFAADREHGVTYLVA